MCAKHYRKWIYATPNPPKKPNARELILAALPGTYDDLAKKTGLSKGSLVEWVPKLRGKELYVCDWQKKGCTRVMVFAKGAKPDVPCNIPPMTKAEYGKRYRERHHDKVLQRQRMHYAIKRAKVRPDPLVAALFGVRQ